MLNGIVEASLRRAVSIRIMTRDEPGILAKVTNTISAAGINIGFGESLLANETAGQGRLNRSSNFGFPDVSALTGVMRELRKVKGVRSVERVRG